LTISLKQSILDEARRLGFTLAGVTTPEPPPHFATFENWIAVGRHASMAYLEKSESLIRRADPRSLLPECKSILVLAIPYSAPLRPPISASLQNEEIDSDPAEMGGPKRGRVASYAWGDDYHLVLPKRMKMLVSFIEKQVGHTVANRFYTDTGPLLERDLAQRAGLGWIGKNTCLIHPQRGSYFLLAEILLDLELETDTPIVTDHCGTCTRCLDACPTRCILPDRTLDASRCISYLTIELKDDIPADLRPMLGEWVFGCDICQMVCPWNRFASETGDPAFEPRGEQATPLPGMGPGTAIPLPVLTRELTLTPDEFNRKFKNSPVKRAKRRGYLRNVAVALGNQGGPDCLPILEQALNDPEPLVREHSAWAIQNIKSRTRTA
jgi:epoxyqueuosine reductase